MKKTLLTVVLFMAFLTTSLNAQTAGWMSRYWDGCKAHCMWTGNTNNRPAGVAKSCNRQNQEIQPNDQIGSGCNGGDGFYCWDHAPVRVEENLAYGFVARNHGSFRERCGECYELTFTGQGQHGHSVPSNNGKRMIVMLSNTGGDVLQDQFDLLVPGGGLGAFDAFSGQLSIQASALGARHGGFVTTCNNDPACVRRMCNDVFGGSGRQDLLSGCLFYVDFLGAQDNPRLTYRTVDCPAALRDWYRPGGRRPTAWTGGSGGDQRTLTINRNPTAGGNVTVNGTQQNTGSSNHANNASVTVVATPNAGYTFQNWTGAPSGVTATNPSITFNITSNVTLTANFQQQGGGDQRTLTINRNPTAGGNVTVNGTQQNTGSSNHANNASVTVAAAPNAGYTFQNWTGAPSGVNATAASITFNITSNVTLTANFQQSGTVDPDNLVRDGSFPGSSLTSNWIIENNSGDRMNVSVSGGRATLNINNVGGNPWEPQLIQRGINLVQGENYRLTFTAAAAANRSMVVLVQRVGGDDGSGWTAYAEQTFNLTTTPQTFTLDFTMNNPSDANTQLAFNVGGGSTQNVTISDVRLVRVLSSVRYSGVRNNAPSQIALKPAVRGFTAALPVGHGYTSYRLIDIQGREVKSGQLSAGTTDLRFNNLRSGVLFLRLEGQNNATTVLRAVTY